MDPTGTTTTPTTGTGTGGTGNAAHHVTTLQGNTQGTHATTAQNLPVTT